jgi:hypothetical protein
VKHSIRELWRNTTATSFKKRHHQRLAAFLYATVMKPTNHARPNENSKSTNEIIVKANVEKQK